MTPDSISTSTVSAGSMSADSVALFPITPLARARRWLPLMLLISGLVLVAVGTAYAWIQPGGEQATITALLMVVLAQAILLLLTWRHIGFHNSRLVKRLGHLVHEDALTGVTNRRGLDERLPQEMARALRSGQLLTVAMLDLDHFKRFNDRRGHGAGDVLLRGAAQAWRKQLRPSDLLARYGGEEFTLVLPSCDAEQAQLLIERLRPVVPDHQTFSAGIATWNGEDDAIEFLRSADIALLAAKKAGRNCTMVSGQEPQMGLPLRMASSRAA